MATFPSTSLHIAGKRSCQCQREPQSFSFPELKAVEGQIFLEKSGRFGENKFPSLQPIGKDLKIGFESGGGIENGFPNLKTIEQKLLINGHDAVRITGFGRLENVKTVELGNVTEFRDLTSLRGLSGKLKIAGHHFQGLNSLEIIAGDLLFRGRADYGETTTIEGLNALQTVEGKFELLFAPFTSLDNFSNLYAVGGDIVFDEKMKENNTVDDFLERIEHHGGEVRYQDEE